MQDIRKPYTRSRSSNDLQSRVEQFETARYRNDERVDYQNEPVQIPTKRIRRDVKDMDMYPRRREELYEQEQYEDERDVSVYKRESRNPPHRIKRRGSLNTILFIFGVLVLVIGTALYTYVFDSATINITPKSKELNTSGQTFLFSKDGKDISGVPFVVMSTSISKTKTLSMSESRKVEAKASGKVIVYNNYDSNPQKLIKNTRFESSKGKIYRINQSVEVPGKKGSIPGSIEVTLYADSNGAEYNIDSTSFTIPGFKGTARESAFYAKTKSSISGGSSGTMSLASLSDINAAKDSLALEIGNEIKTELSKLKKEGYIPMLSATEITYQDNEEEILRGVTGIYKVTAVGSLPLALGSKLAEVLAKTLGDYDGAPVRLQGTDSLVFTKKETDTLQSSSTISILVEGKPRVIWESDADAIKELVKGKSREEFKPLMKKVNSIESAEVSFSPLWLSHFPLELTKVTVVEVASKR